MRLAGPERRDGNRVGLAGREVRGVEVGVIGELRRAEDQARLRHEVLELIGQDAADLDQQRGHVPAVDRDFPVTAQAQERAASQDLDLFGERRDDGGVVPRLA